MADRGVMSRLLPITGIATVVLWFLSFVIGSEDPDWEDPASEMVQFFQDDAGKIIGGSLVFLAGCLVLLWFLNLVRTRLGEVEGEARFSSLAFAAGTGTAIVLMLSRAASLGLAIALEDSDAQLEAGAAQFAILGSTGFFVVAELLAAVFLLALAKIAMGSGLLPKWFTWITIALAVVMLIPPIGWAGLIFVFPLWVIAAGFLLQGGRAPAPAP